ncbi:hypothetical protein [Streptomyces longwoodensis]|uniref:hypothetical protein n=1 Tax=Streptomyces longwoodensis TaxID=68231 RepID=UPI0033F18DB7
MKTVNEVVTKLWWVAQASLFTDRSRVQAVCGNVDRCRHIVAHVLKTFSGKEEKAVPEKYFRAGTTRKKRRPDAVSVLVDRAVLGCVRRADG